MAKESLIFDAKHPKPPLYWFGILGMLIGGPLWTIWMLSLFVQEWFPRFLGTEPIIALVIWIGGGQIIYLVFSIMAGVREAVGSLYESDDWDEKILILAPYMHYAAILCILADNGIAVGNIPKPIDWIKYMIKNKILSPIKNHLAFKNKIKKYRETPRIKNRRITY
jgi:hypothetical protein